MVLQNGYSVKPHTLSNSSENLWVFTELPYGKQQFSGGPNRKYRNFGVSVFSVRFGKIGKYRTETDP